jgi:hypothetical protein
MALRVESGTGARAVRAARAARRLGAALIAAAPLLAGAPAGAVRAAPAPQAAFGKGAVVALRGTPHLWFGDEQGTLHWAGDTRALDGHAVAWTGNRTEVSLEQLRSLPIGDPWLSAGLLKDGDPIYLVKWEADWPQPRLQRIQSIGDVELFGITGRNYGQLVLDRPEWERRFGLQVGGLTRTDLPPAVAPAAPAVPGQVVLADSFDDVSQAILPTASSDPSRLTRGYQGGEYVLKTLVPDLSPFVRLPAVPADASLAVDARIAGDADGRLIMLGCRENEAGDREYRLMVDPADGVFLLIRVDGDSFKPLAEPAASPAIRRGTQSNRFELSCAGDTIAVRINGTQVASVKDSTYREGGMWVGASSFKEGRTVEVHFDNLTVTRR